MFFPIRKRSHIVQLFFLILLFIIPIRLDAQIITQDTLEVELEEIRVEAARSSITIEEAPMSLTYFIRDGAEISSRPAATMNELSFTLPGIFISNRENYALGERLTIRGLGWRTQFGVRGTQVVLDGMPLTVADGQTIMNMVDPAMIKSIEVLRGPSATFWGNSSGGVLYLSTRPDRSAPTLRYRGYGGSFSTLKQEVEVNTTYGKSRIYGYGTYFDTDGFRNHSSARLWRGSLGFERPISDRGNLRIRTSYSSMPLAQHPGSLTFEDAEETPQAATPSFVNREAGKTFDQAMIGSTYLHRFDSGILDVTLHGTYRDLQNPLPFGVIGLERYAGGIRSNYQFDWGSADFQVGADLKVQLDDRLETNNVNGGPGDEVSVQQQENVYNRALFSRVTLPVSSRWSISGGVRADWIDFEIAESIGNSDDGSRSFFSVNPSIGLLYSRNAFDYYTNFSTSFESPTTVELVNSPQQSGGFNQDIEPEKAISLETGVRGRKSGGFYDLALFAMRVDNLLSPYQLSEDGPTFFRNQGKTEHFGIEAAAGYRLSNLFSFRLAFTALSAQFEGGEFDGNSLPGVPPVRFGAIAEFTPGPHHISLENEWVSDYYADNANSAKNSAHTLFHFRWTMQIDSFSSLRQLRPFIAVSNLLDTRFNSSVFVNAFGNRYFEPGSERSLRAGLQLAF